MQKAAREAKVHTSWIEENQEYSRALLHFVEETLAGRTARRFLASEWCEAAGSDHSSLPMAMALRTCPVALLWAPVRDRGVQADAA
jgi:hypothetical protein